MGAEDDEKGPETNGSETAQDDPTLDLEALEASMEDGYTYGDDGSYSWTNPHADKIAALEAQIERHPAYKAHGRLRDLGRVLRVWHMYSLMLTQLLTELEASEEASVELIRNVGDTSTRERIVLSLDQALVAYVAGLKAVIDHARVLSQGQSKGLQARYAERTQKLVVDLPYSAFLVKFRNYILHNVVAPWGFTVNTMEDGTTHSTIYLNTAPLLESKSWWDAGSKAFLSDSGDSIHLLPLLEPYRAALVAHIDVLMREIWDEIDPELDKLRELGRKRALLMTGGITNGDDWEDRMAHIQENIFREQRGEPALNYQTGKPFTEEERAETRGAFGEKTTQTDPQAPHGD